MEQFYYAKDESGLSREEIRAALQASLEGRTVKKALIIPPDFTRFHSQAGLITNIYYHLLTDAGCQVDVMPALGTHEPVSKPQSYSYSLHFALPQLHLSCLQSSSLLSSPRSFPTTKRSLP